MKKNIYFYTNLFAWGLVLVLIGNYVFGWTTPTGNPPTSNLSAPINVSSTAQTKTGSLTVEGLLKIGQYSSSPSGSIGELYFDTTANEFKGYKSTGWDSLGGGAGLWALTGSDIYYSDGKVSIGTSTSPTYTLDVVGTGRFTSDLTGSAFYYASDERLKENIQRIDTSLAKIIKLDGISFNWKESGKKSIGLIAQDVEKVFPEIVNTEEETGLKSIEYAKLIAPLIEAIKEQQKMINEQKELIDQQGEQIKTLKVLIEQF